RTWRRSPPTPRPRRTTSCWPSCCTRTTATPRPRWSTRRRRATIRRMRRAATPAMRRCCRTRRSRSAPRPTRGPPRSPAPTEVPALKRAGVESALRFAKAFPADTRTGPVLTDAAEKLYGLGEGERAAAVAQQVLDLNPPAAPAQRRVASTVIAHTAFERGAFDRAEKAYGDVLALVPEKDPARADLAEPPPASAYKQ